MIENSFAGTSSHLRLLEIFYFWNCTYILFVKAWQIRARQLTVPAVLPKALDLP
jgi:hypothetical protein